MRQHQIRKTEAHALYVARTCRGLGALLSVYQVDGQLMCVWFT